MVRKTLLATTALVLGTTVAFAMHVNAPIHKAPPLRAPNYGNPGHVVHGVPVNLAIGNTKNLPPVRNNKLPSMTSALFSNFSKYANALFLSWYGFTFENSAFSSYYSSHDWFRFKAVANNAIPFSTSGGSAKSMSFGGFTYYSTAEIQGEILSSSGGLPGNVVAKTKLTTESDNGLCCQSLRKVGFKGGAITLPAGNYFASVVCGKAPCYGGWAMEDIDFSGATVDYWHFKDTETYNFGTGTHTSHYSSPWHASTSIPSAGAVLIK